MTALIAPVLALGLAGCGDGDSDGGAGSGSALVHEEPVESESVDEVDDVVSEEISDEATGVATNDTTAEEASGESDSGSPELGEPAAVGDWTVTVTEVNRDADALIARTNEFNDRAKDRFLLVTYEATYNGAARSADVWVDLTWTFTTTDQKVWDTSSQVAPADDEEWPTEARSGGTVRGQVVFDVDPRLVEGGILSVESYDADFNDVFADFVVE